MQKIDLTKPDNQPDNQPEEVKHAKPENPVDSVGNLPDNQALPKSTARTKKDQLDMKKVLKPLLILVVVAVFAGVGTGYQVYRTVSSKDTGLPADGNIQKVAGTEINAGDVFGSTDEKTFKDSAEGYLEQGDPDDEGTHKLLRPGGEMQTVYLTSSVTDLDKLVGMEVKVWGETFKGQKAGWLMDVGRVRVEKVDGDSPVID